MGTPAIAWAGSWLQEFPIVVRAKNALNQVRLYYTFFYQNSFYGLAFPGASFTQLPLVNPPPISSDPALEWGPDLQRGAGIGANTLYWLSTSGAVSSIVQTSGFAADWPHPIRTIRPDNPRPFVTAPTVYGGVMYDLGQHVVVSRAQDGHFYFAQTLEEEYVTE